MSFSPAAAANSALPDLLAGFEGPLRGGENRGEREGRQEIRKWKKRREKTALK